MAVGSGKTIKLRIARDYIKSLSGENIISTDNDGNIFMTNEFGTRVMKKNKMATLKYHSKYYRNKRNEYL